MTGIANAAMIIAQISDTHIALDTDDSDRRICDFERTIADINELDPAPDVVVHTGDIVHNGREEEYAKAVQILAAAKVPVYVMAGNKDAREPLRAAFMSRGYLSPDSVFIDYVVERFPLRLIMLDTLNPDSNKGDFCAERAARFIEMALAGDHRPVAVFAHHPPFKVDVGPDPIHFDKLEAMARMRDALQQCPMIAGLFCGHVHRAAFGSVGTIPASVVQCVATPLRKGEYPASMASRPIYHLHRFDPQWGTITETRIVDSTKSCVRLLERFQLRHKDGNS